MVVNLYEFDFWVGVSLYFEVDEPNACTKSKLYGNVSLPVTSTSPEPPFDLGYRSDTCDNLIFILKKRSNLGLDEPNLSLKFPRFN